jgi:hypothetical protein
MSQFDVTGNLVEWVQAVRVGFYLLRRIGLASTSCAYDTGDARFLSRWRSSCRPPHPPFQRKCAFDVGTAGSVLMQPLNWDVIVWDIFIILMPSEQFWKASLSKRKGGFVCTKKSNVLCDFACRHVHQPLPNDCLRFAICFTTFQRWGPVKHVEYRTITNS